MDWSWVHSCEFCEKVELQSSRHDRRDGELELLSSNVSGKTIRDGAQAGCSFFSLLQDHFRHPFEGEATNPTSFRLRHAATEERPPERRKDEAEHGRLVLRLDGRALDKWFQHLLAREEGLTLQIIKANLWDRALESWDQRFYMLAREEDPIASILKRYLPKMTPGSDSSLSRARGWLADCQKNHSNCSLAEEGEAPTRLLKLDQEEAAVRLISPQEHCSYAALSYCWGGDQPCKLTKARLADYEGSIKVASLPQSIQDAIRVVREFDGVSYLWVDALCIIQDDSFDMARELRKMADIYRGAEVTISAAAAGTSDGGFLGPREWHDRGRIVAHVPFQHEAGPPETAYVATEDWSSGSKRRKDPINARAWTLQEHVLSRRILYYSSEQLYWMCISQRYCDGGCPADGVSRPLVEGAMELFAFPHSIDAGVWRSLLKEYTSRKLSDPNDRYVAIDAVGRAIGKQLGTEYVCGLLANDLPRPPYRAPSWSWASIDGPISFRYFTNWVSTVEILGWNVELLDPDARYGAIRSGEIRIRGWAGSHRLVFGEDLDGLVLSVRGTDMYLDFYADTTEGDLEDVWIVELLRNTERYTESRGLVLVEKGPGVFRRVGVWFVDFARLSILSSGRQGTGGASDVPLALDLHEREPRIV